VKFYYESLLEEERTAKHIAEKQDYIMLSDIASSVQYLEVKRTAED